MTQVNERFDGLIFEMNCLGCGKVSFSLPYQADMHHTMTCQQCGEVTIVHVLPDGSLATATLAQRDEACLQLLKEIQGYVETLPYSLEIEINSGKKSDYSLDIENAWSWIGEVKKQEGFPTNTRGWWQLDGMRLHLSLGTTMLASRRSRTDVAFRNKRHIAIRSDFLITSEPRGLLSQFKLATTHFYFSYTDDGWARSRPLSEVLQSIFSPSFSKSHTLVQSLAGLNLDRFNDQLLVVTKGPASQTEASSAT